MSGSGSSAGFEELDGIDVKAMVFALLTLLCGEGGTAGCMEGIGGCEDIARCFDLAGLEFEIFSSSI
jgi:hypothetical protein